MIRIFYHTHSKPFATYNMHSLSKLKLGKERPFYCWIRDRHEIVVKWSKKADICSFFFFLLWPDVSQAKPLLRKSYCLQSTIDAASSIFQSERNRNSAAKESPLLLLLWGNYLPHFCQNFMVSLRISVSAYTASCGSQCYEKSDGS